MIAAFFRHMLGLRNDEPRARLTPAEAERIARIAAAASPLADELVLRGMWQEAGQLAWHFWTPARGTHLLVSVDDATGNATMEHVHAR